MMQAKQKVINMAGWTYVTLAQLTSATFLGAVAIGTYGTVVYVLGYGLILLANVITHVFDKLFNC